MHIIQMFNNSSKPYRLSFPTGSIPVMSLILQHFLHFHHSPYSFPFNKTSHFHLHTDLLFPSKMLIYLLFIYTSLYSSPLYKFPYLSFTIPFLDPNTFFYRLFPLYSFESPHSTTFFGFFLPIITVI